MNPAAWILSLTVLAFASPSQGGECDSRVSTFHPADKVISTIECRNVEQLLCVTYAYNAIRNSKYFRVTGHSRYSIPLQAWEDSATADSAANNAESALSLYHEPDIQSGRTQYRTEMIIQKSSGSAVFLVEQNIRGSKNDWSPLIRETLNCKFPE